MVAEALHPSLGIILLEAFTVLQINSAAVLLAGHCSTFAILNAFVLPQCLSYESFVLTLVSVMNSLVLVASDGSFISCGT